MPNVTTWLRLVKAEHNLTQREIGGMAGVGQQAVSEWILGHSQPKPEHLVALCSGLGIEVPNFEPGQAAVGNGAVHPASSPQPPLRLVSRGSLSGRPNTESGEDAHRRFLEEIVIPRLSRGEHVRTHEIAFFERIAHLYGVDLSSPIP